MVATGAAVTMVAKDVFIYVYIFTDTRVWLQPAQPSQWSRKTPLIYTCIYLIQSVVATGATVTMVAKDAFIYMYIFNTECGCNRRSRRNGRERRLYIHVHSKKRCVNLTHLFVQILTHL